MVGIIGVGMVGSAMLQSFQEAGVAVVAYDKFKPYFQDTDFREFLECDLVFVSVPTLTHPSGDQDQEPLEEVYARLRSIGFTGIVVSKCTVVPGTTRRMSNISMIRTVHYPEFLRAATAYDDFKFQKVALLSGDPEPMLQVADFLKAVFPSVTIKLFERFEATEIAKYIHNCFASIKLSAFNEFYDVCKLYQVSYDNILDALLRMEVIGVSHTAVPGPDGRRGWGGFCFPKDTSAFLHKMDGQGMNMQTLDAAIRSNKSRRGEE